MLADVIYSNQISQIGLKVATHELNPFLQRRIFYDLFSSVKSEIKLLIGLEKIPSVERVLNLKELANPNFLPISTNLPGGT